MKNEEKLEAAIGQLESLYQEAISQLRSALGNYVANRVAPTKEQREKFRYPKITLTYDPDGPAPVSSRAYAKFNAPGTYTTTITHPKQFAPYLREQILPLLNEYGASIEVGVSTQEIPYAYVIDGQNELGVGDVPPDELARHFPTPSLNTVGDEIVENVIRNGQYIYNYGDLLKKMNININEMKNEYLNQGLIPGDFFSFEEKNDLTHILTRYSIYLV